MVVPFSLRGESFNGVINAGAVGEGSGISWGLFGDDVFLVIKVGGWVAVDSLCNPPAQPVIGVGSGGAVRQIDIGKTVFIVVAKSSGISPFCLLVKVAV